MKLKNIMNFNFHLNEKKNQQKINNKVQNFIL